MTDQVRFADHGWGRFNARRSIPPCRWDRFDLLAVHRGRLRLEFEKRRQVLLEPGLAVLIYPHTGFRGWSVGAGCQATVQHFALPPRSDAGALPLVLRQRAGRRHGYEILRMADRRQARHDIQRALHAAFGPQDEARHDQRVALLTLILSQLQPIQADELTRPAADWTDLDPWLRRQMHREWTVEALAQQMGLSPSRFRQRFTQALGVSPARHLRRLRMAEAQRLLRETDLPIKTIGRRLTYRDLPNFYRVFRSVVGSTPGAYRARHTLSG